MASSIRTVNLLWEKRVRGTYPVSGYALADTGAATLAVPRPLEVRTYDVTEITPDGSSTVQNGFSVETLLKLELTTTGDSFLGMTADDLYLFANGGKERFQDARHVLYTDAALSDSGRVFVTGFSDMAASSFALAYGEIGGRIVWTREVEAPIAGVAISRNGARLVLGAENGTLWLLDSGRRELWEFQQPGTLRALAASEDGLLVAYGTAEGTVGLIDGEGTRRWETHVPGEIVRLALSGDGSVCAVLSVSPEAPGETRISVLSEGGITGWEYTAERRVTGLALSPSGRYMAAGGRDGMTSVYEVVAGKAGSGVVASDLFEMPLLSGTGGQDASGSDTYLRLRAALAANPADLALFERVQTAKAAWLATSLEAVGASRQAADYQAALDKLSSVLAIEPHSYEAVALWEGVSLDRARQLIDVANNLLAAGDEPDAERSLRQAIEVAPDLPEARRALAQMATNRAVQADADADAHLAQGDLEAGVAALERAQALAPSPERAHKMAFALTAMEFASGMAAYNEKHYREAIFQFKKVVARDPGHSEARRYLGYAQRFEQDSSSGSLQDRFSMLE